MSAARRPAAPGAPRAVTRDEIVAEATALLDEGRRVALVSGHDDGDELRVVYSFTGPTPGLVEELAVSVPASDAWIPSLAAHSYPAATFERELRDLFGIRPVGHPQPYRLVRHGHWPRGWYPLRRDAAATPDFAPDVESFPFLEVEGAGVYEIAVGPIHAGIIEPGHFRFSVVGETILRMEPRLWYMHRGVERLFQGRSPEAGMELAEAVAGDTAVGHALGYAMAIEAAVGMAVPEPARRQRALLLELERMYNHVTDLGMLAGDTAFSIVNIHAGRLREQLLRLNERVTGHRLLRGSIALGGAELRALPEAGELEGIAAEVAELVTITLDHPIVRDRLTGTARLDAEQARALGTLGYVARASGIDADARRDHPFVPLGDRFEVVTESSGDVLGRYLVRAREFAVSAAVAADLAASLGGTLHGTDSPTRRKPRGSSTAPGVGLGLVEGWRGTIACRVETAPDGTLARVKIADPSFFNWPALPVALGDGVIVPDFPLANKSFNQSYAGNDL